MKLINVIAFCVLFTVVFVAGSPRARALTVQSEPNGYTPLKRAAERGQVNVVRALLKSGVEVDAGYPYAPTALMIAAGKGHLLLVNTLLAAGANVNAKRSNGYTALMASVEWLEPSITSTLIAAGADVRAKNKFGETTLALARKKKNTDAIAILKRAGAKE